MEPSELAMRAVLKKEGCVDIRFELRRTSSFDFTIVENGKEVGVFWRTISPQQAIWGGGPTPVPIREAWKSCLAKRFPDYTATNLEEAAREVNEFLAGR